MLKLIYILNTRINNLIVNKLFRFNSNQNKIKLHIKSGGESN